MNAAVTLVVPYTESKWRGFCSAEASDMPVIYDADRTLAIRYGAAQGRLGVFVDEEAVRRIARPRGPSS